MATRREGNEELEADQLVTYAKLDAERKLVSRLLNHPDELPAAQAVLEPWGPAAVYSDQFRVVLEALVALARDGVALAGEDGKANLDAVIAELDERGDIPQSTGPSEVRALTLRSPARPAEWYARIVRAAYPGRLAAETCAALCEDLGSSKAIADPIGALTGVLEAAKAVLDATTKHRQSPFHLMSVHEVLTQPRPEPFIESYFTLNSTGLLIAPPGAGKTALVFDMLGAVTAEGAEHATWQGHPVKQGHVVYICAEGQAFLPERLEALMEKLGVDDLPRLHILAVRVQLLEPHTVPDLLATFAAELPEQPVCVVVDTLNQTANGADENDASDMSRYVGALDRIREETGGAFALALHHTGKDKTKGARGSSALEGNFDTIVELVVGDGVSTLRCVKQRGGWAPFKPFSFRVTSAYLDEEAVRTGPIIEPCDAVAVADKPLSPTWAHMLGAFVGHPEGTAAGAWLERATPVSHGTFYENKPKLEAAGYVCKQGNLYFLTAAGLAKVQVQPKSTWTATGPGAIDMQQVQKSSLLRELDQLDLPEVGIPKPKGWSYKDQPEWKQANREKRETVQRLRQELARAWPETAFRIKDNLTYSPSRDECPFPVWVDWTGGPQEADVAQWVAGQVEGGKAKPRRNGYGYDILSKVRRFRVEYSLSRDYTDEERAEQHRRQEAGLCWRCASANIETAQKRSVYTILDGATGEERLEEHTSKWSTCRECGTEWLPGDGGQGAA